MRIENNELLLKNDYLESLNQTIETVTKNLREKYTDDL